jgi:hypothetical protein
MADVRKKTSTEDLEARGAWIPVSEAFLAQG